MGVVLALGYEDTPVQANIRLLALALDGPISTYVMCMPSFVCVMCAFDCASTYSSGEVRSLAFGRPGDIRCGTCVGNRYVRSSSFTPIANFLGGISD